MCRRSDREQPGPRGRRVSPRELKAALELAMDGATEGTEGARRPTHPNARPGRACASFGCLLPCARRAERHCTADSLLLTALLAARFAGLDLLAGAAGSAMLAKRKQALKPGRNVCWFGGCRCTTGLKGVPVSRVQDAMHALTVQPGLDLGIRGGGARVLPANAAHNRLCPAHMPPLGEIQILGNGVALDREGGGLLIGKIVAEVPAPAFSNGALRERQWRVVGEVGEAHAEAVILDSEVAAAVARRQALEAFAGAQRRERIGEMHKVVDKLQHALKRARPGAPAPAAPTAPALPMPQPPPAPRRNPPSPRRNETTAGAPPGSAPAAEMAKIRVTHRLPQSYVVGMELAFDIARGHLPGSEPQTVVIKPGEGAAPGDLVDVEVMLCVRRTPAPPTVPPKAGKSAAALTSFIERRVAANGLDYSPTPNPLNPRKAGPLREELSFANLRPEYFELEENQGLFKKLFGFSCWGDAMALFERVHLWERKRGLSSSTGGREGPAGAQVPARGRGGRSTALVVGGERSLIAPQFQYLAALWRMRQRKDMDELARTFGVLTPRMSGW